jgi:hypothetical protein
MSDKSTERRHLTLADLTFEKSAFEIRYAQNELHWDRAGLIWHTMKRKYPDLRMKHAQPNNTAFTLNKSIDLNLTTENASVIAQYPPATFETFLEIAQFFNSVLCETLEILSFTRIGFRPIYTKSFPSVKDAAKALLSTAMVVSDIGTPFGIKDATFTPEIILRWKAENGGGMVRGLIEERGVELDITPGFEEIKPFKVEKAFLVIDFDYYNAGAISVGQIRVSDWIKNAHQVIRKDAGRFIGGKSDE